jgi:hypothetical protein
MNASSTYPIGNVGQPWSDSERAAWRSQLSKQRSYADDVLSWFERLRARYEVVNYGQLDYPPDSYPLLALRNHDWDAKLPYVLVTGGVHGYETSGVHGALQFAERQALRYAGRANLLIAPCVSPWAYERIHRWNANAVDPNRSFRPDSPSEEAAALMRLVDPFVDRFLLHIDLHETTDSDESEFRPALAARDGKPHEPGEIPDGFYLVGDSANPQLAFQQSIIAAVRRYTHIAPSDAQGEIIGSKAVAPGVILYDFKGLGLCAGLTNAPFTTTTEVYPDSPKVTPELCRTAQVTAVVAAIDYALAHR